jgi:hypothetical protein
MTRLRRAIAVMLVLLASPSVVWLLMTLFDAIPNSSQQSASAELVFVICCLAAAGAAWTAVRFWPLVVLVVAAAYTYVITGPLVTGVLLVAPVGYIAGVLGEAADRGISGGMSIVWSLLVLPIAFPALFVLAGGLCIASRRAQNASAI